jgi:hypothetical protein
MATFGMIIFSQSARIGRRKLYPWDRREGHEDVLMSEKGSYDIVD